MEAVRVSKEFPGARALDDVDLDVRRGEIHALIGENGAGKSTLIKILAGALQADSGEVRVDGTPVNLKTVRQARNRGISVVPQNVLRVPGFNVGRNLLLGDERIFARRRRLSAEEKRRTHDALQRVGADVGLDRPMATLSVPEMRLCQIASTLSSPGRIVVLDEPTAVLSPHDADALIQRLLALRGEGHAILYVSHRLPEVMRVADRVTVLTNGRVVKRVRTADTSRDELVSAMARVEGGAAPRPIHVSEGPKEEGYKLEVRGLSSSHVADVSLEAEPGQIVGLAGVQGSGHGDVLSLIVSLQERTAGEVELNGRRVGARSAVGAYDRGISLIPADRTHAAILPALSVQDNLVLVAHSPCQRFGVRLRRREARNARALVEQLGIRPPRLRAPARTLSGGNQQKVALGRLLHADVRVILLEEPTQGVDVNGKEEIFRLVNALAEQGRTIVWASSEFEELRDHAHRIIVMCAGRIAGELKGGEVSYRDILNLALPSE